MLQKNLILYRTIHQNNGQCYKKIWYCIVQLVWEFYIIILIVQNYFFDLYPAKIFAKSFFPCKKINFCNWLISNRISFNLNLKRGHYYYYYYICILQTISTRASPTHNFDRFKCQQESSMSSEISVFISLFSSRDTEVSLGVYISRECVHRTFHFAFKGHLPTCVARKREILISKIQ